MSNPAALGALCYEAEASWAEDVTTFATHRIPIIGAVDASGLTHEKLAPDGVYQRRQEGSPHILGKIGGSFTTKIDWPGHGATTAGSPSVDALETFIALATGVTAALSATASTTLTGGSAAAPTTTASGTLSAGSVCFVGALGDGDGDGQMYGIDTHVTTTLTLLNALRGAPVNGAVLYPAVMHSIAETPTTGAITGTRVLLQTANLQYECHGCFPTGFTISGTSPGERPQLTITWAVSWWRYSTATFPSVVTSNRYNPAVIAAGSLHVQDVGTATRNERTLCRSFSIDYTLGVEPLIGNGGVNAYQTIVGARRTTDKIKVTWTEDADAATTTPILPGYGTASTRKVVCWTGSTAIGSRIGILLRSVCIDSVAIQKMDGNINRLTTTGTAYTGATLTNDLTCSAFVMGSA